MVRLIMFYRRWVSPLLPPRCRFYPSCSEYALTAIELHGRLKGSALATKRLCRCHPLCEGGYDPVPGSVPFFVEKTAEKIDEKTDNAASASHWQDTPRCNATGNQKS